MYTWHAVERDTIYVTFKSQDHRSEFMVTVGNNIRPIAKWTNCPMTYQLALREVFFQNKVGHHMQEDFYISASHVFLLSNPVKSWEILLNTLCSSRINTLAGNRLRYLRRPAYTAGFITVQSSLI